MFFWLYHNFVLFAEWSSHLPGIQRTIRGTCWGYMISFEGPIATCQNIPKGPKEEGNVMQMWWLTLPFPLYLKNSMSLNKLYNSTYIYNIYYNLMFWPPVLRKPAPDLRPGKVYPKPTRPSRPKLRRTPQLHLRKSPAWATEAAALLQWKHPKAYPDGMW